MKKRVVLEQGLLIPFLLEFPVGIACFKIYTTYLNPRSGVWN